MQSNPKSTAYIDGNSFICYTPSEHALIAATLADDGLHLARLLPYATPPDPVVIEQKTPWWWYVSIFGGGVLTGLLIVYTAKHIVIEK